MNNRAAKNNRAAILALSSVLLLGVTGCTKAVGAEPTVEGRAAVVRPIKGTELSRVTLTREAMRRIGLATTDVTVLRHSTGRAKSDIARRRPATAVPYSAVIYDGGGVPWAYVRTDPHTFVRHRLRVDEVNGRLAYLSSGPAVGTPVVSRGATELWGAEFGVGGE